MKSRVRGGHGTYIFATRRPPSPTDPPARVLEAFLLRLSNKGRVPSFVLPEQIQVQHHLAPLLSRAPKLRQTENPIASASGRRTAHAHWPRPSAQAQFWASRHAWGVTSARGVATWAWLPACHLGGAAASILSPSLAPAFFPAGEI